MATQYTNRLQLPYWQPGDKNWTVQLAEIVAILDAILIGGLYVVPAEALVTPGAVSASLNIGVTPGAYRKSDGTVIDYAGSSSFGLTASTTNYVFLSDTGTLTANTTGWPASFHVRLAEVLAGTSTLTTITPFRLSGVSAGVNNNTVYLALAGGTFSDGSGVVTVGTGTTNGTMIGATAADKIGFNGKTPIAQPSGAAQAALTNSTGGTATTTLNAVGATNASDVSGTINNNFASLWTLLDAIRTALVNRGHMKGSA